ncbi:hypothetical protein CDAR_199181 [Caerostris darwini]|uniref:Uncharacterized protein n=1 Tax=Caerostris darwini TaxID=1538125 RepID=A0AAV4S4L9_9ARAC|nr:hypothetical protein CDAR_199181 [Caerostris darwini]
MYQSQNVEYDMQQKDNLQQPQAQVSSKLSLNASSNLQQQNSIIKSQQPNFNINPQKQNTSAYHPHSQSTIHSTTTEIQHQAATPLKFRVPTKSIIGIQSLSQTPSTVKDLVTVIAEGPIINGFSSK